MIQIEWATKYFGHKPALDEISFVAVPGAVTALIGPNGAGKTTLFRCLLGLDTFDSGEGRINGVPYISMRNPPIEVGVMLDSRHGHPGRTAFQQLRAQAIAIGLGKERVYAMLEMVGLASVANQRIGTYSLGMKQRLGLAVALLGEPKTLILDEPLNGLDSDGILWVRGLVRSLAAEGRTVLLASHIMSEVEKTADNLVILGKGRVLLDAPVRQALRHVGVEVASTNQQQLAELLTHEGIRFRRTDDFFIAHGISACSLSQRVASGNIALTHLAEIKESVEQAYLRVTEEMRDYLAVGAESNV